MLCRSAVVVVAVCMALGCSTVQKVTAPPGSVTQEQLARVPPDQMRPVNQARSELAAAKDEAARRDIAVKSADQEVDVAKQEVNVAKSQADKTNASLNKANFDRNSQAGQQAQRELTIYQAQLEAAQGHLNAANAAADLAKAQRKQADAERDLAEARVQLAEVVAVKKSGDPAAKNVNEDSARARVDDRLKAIAESKTEVTRLQNKAEQERAAWQTAVKHYNSLRGTGGAAQ